MAKTRRKSRRKPKPKPLGTIWEIPDASWEKILPILLESWPKEPTGRRTADRRAALDGLIFRMRTGCQWEPLPREFGPKSTVHDWFQRWSEGGIRERIRAAFVAGCDELGGVDGPWQGADAMLGKARFGGERDGQESHGSRREGHQEVGADRWPGRAAGGDDRRGRRAGAEDAPRHDRGDRRRAARADGRGPAGPVAGWGL